MAAEFVHLHVHSHYTLLESPITPAKLIAAVQAKGMPAVALTDRGNLFGAFEFASAAKDASDKAKGPADKAAEELKAAQAAAAAKPDDAALAAAVTAATEKSTAATAKAKKSAVKPIIGCQVNIAPLGMAERVRDTNQLVLLAQDETGYRNLSKLVSLGWLKGFYFEPRVDLETIAAHSAGLICLTGAGDDGFLNKHLRAGAVEEAARQLGLLKDVFADRLYVELSDFGDVPMSYVATYVDLARAAGVPYVATNWVHYLGADDHKIQDVQLAIKKVTTVADTHRRRMPSADFWLKSAEEMAARFSGLPDAIANTLAVAERCSGKVIPQGQYYLPKFPCPEGQDEKSLLRAKCLEGMTRRYADGVGASGAKTRKDLDDRLEFELSTISNMGFEAYFLIVADFIGWAKARGIPVGPGRGSAAGSLVSYCMGITDICPLRYGLLFERFLNPGRKSMPDIDVDFCKDRRGEVIEYVAQKYGRDAVTQIMTLGTMKARMAIKDVARAYEWTPEESQELANLVPEDPSGKHDLQVCLGRKPLDKDVSGAVDAMVKRYDTDPRTHQVLDTALQLEKLGRSLGVHACGIIIAPGPVSMYVPVCVVKEKAATQYNMGQVEKCGLLKMDFLGLKTMSILKKSADIVKANGGPDIGDYGGVPLDDAKTFELLGHGDTLGVFQCESSGFQALIRQLKPDRFEDMIALVALYRPGPLQANMHIQYCDRKHGREKVDYPHMVLERSLKETYGLYIYQEQVMNISRELCGFTPAEADDLRKAMGKKDINVLKKLEEKFVSGADKTHQFPRDKCTEMWNKILGFASYCFNKSHSACYGLIAYWTAYMKANHYAAFMTANLIYEMDNKDKMTRFVEELRTKGIPVLPPDVNESGWEFTLVNTGIGGDLRQAVRFGFGGVKAVGEGAAEQLIKKRVEGGPFKNLYDLCERVDTRVINKRVVESMVKVGALDSMHANRRALFEAQDRAFDRGSRLAKSKADKQETLFASFETDTAFREERTGYPNVPDWSENERLAFEKALTGYWISSHPLASAGTVISRLGLGTSRELATTDTGARVTIAAVVLAKRMITTKAGKGMAVLSLEDQYGRFEAVLFGARANKRGQVEPGPYERFAAECEPDLVALFTGTVERRERRQQKASGGGGGGGPPPMHSDEDDSAPPPPEQAEDAEAEVEALPSIIVAEMVPLALVTERLAREIVVQVDAGDAQAATQATTETRSRITRTELLFKENPGNIPVKFQVHTPQDVLITLTVGEAWRIHATDNLVTKLEEIWGRRRITVRCADPAQARQQHQEAVGVG
jgi:DNA polymerase-3 subunit alpha